jgi:hypothetical protein
LRASTHNIFPIFRSITIPHSSTGRERARHALRVLDADEVLRVLWQLGSPVSKRSGGFSGFPLRKLTLFQGALQGRRIFRRVTSDFLSPHETVIRIDSRTNVSRRRSSIEHEFRGEFFNAFNHAQFNLPDSNTENGANFGRISSARTPRLIQLGLKLLF